MLPVLLIFISGFIFQRVFMLDIKPISTMAMYLLLPFLVFKTFYQQPINQSFFYIVVTSIIIMALLIVIGLIIAKLLHYNKKKTNAFLLATVFANNGNYGVPVALFAFGQKGLAYAMPLMIFYTILMGVVGIYIAASGTSGVKTAFISVLKQPMNYAIIPGIIFQQMSLTMPSNLMKTVNMISQTAIPVIMLVLGMQLANVMGKHIDWRSVGIVSIVRLIISPVIAYLICIPFHLSPLLQNIIVVMAAMPSAANTTIYAIQYNTEPEFVSSATLITTIVSIPTLTLLLNFVS
ncbi:AEC family transporter [Lactobacillus sp. CC-MHH1034]|uniref:AEC family transporter n=1 Tax=Agrilactobacillus fermenti TaxID=2586909 RepID=UPI001E658476|nr:AEC family transporter [Agrilactobacillus fermenti]MCD2256352.1 AEC family transporter [Agrilactobacillus fermenti]